MANETPTPRERMHRGLDMTLDKAEVLGEESMEAMYAAKKKAMGVRNDIGYYIYRDPETAVVVAAGIGLIAGLLVGAFQAAKKHFFSFRLQ